MNTGSHVNIDTVAGQMQLVAEVEEKVTTFLARELAFGNLELHDRRFLVAYWVHFFSNSALSIWFNGKPGQVSLQANYRNVPADTAAFMGLNRTREYANYLRATMTHAMPETEFKVEKQNTILDISRMQSMRVMLYKAGFKKPFRFWLGLLSLGKIRSFNKTRKLPIALRNGAARDRLAEKLRNLLASHDFGAWYSVRLLEFLPAIFVEDFGEIEKEYAGYKSRLHAIFSRDCWSSDDSLKLFSVLSTNRNNAKPKRIGSPHAMNYGTLKEFWLRDFETKFLDRYLSWGWQYRNITPFYAAQYSGQEQCRVPATIGNDFEILITGAARPGHLIEYPYTAEAFASYMDNQIGLAETLAEETGQLVTIRTRQKDRGQELENRIRARGEIGFRFEYQGEAFTKRVRNCLHISDNTSTTVIETLWMNHPTLLLIEPVYFEIWENAAEEFGLLKQAGIFHESRESIVRFILENRGRINEWWRKPATQNAVRFFLEKQGRPSGTLKDWKNILLGEK